MCINSIFNRQKLYLLLIDRGIWPILIELHLLCLFYFNLTSSYFVSFIFFLFYVFFTFFIFFVFFTFFIFFVFFTFLSFLSSSPFLFFLSSSPFLSFLSDRSVWKRRTGRIDIHPIKYNWEDCPLKAFRLEWKKYVGGVILKDNIDIHLFLFDYKRSYNIMWYCAIWCSVILYRLIV